MKYKVTLSNSGGEIDARVVARIEDTREAALEIISSLDFLCDGDKVTVSEVA